LTSTSTRDRAQASVWRTPAFLWLWAARSVSLTGSAVTLVVLPILVFQRTGSPLQTSLLTLLEAVPYVLFGLLAGALADRVDRRRIMVACDLCSAALLATIPLAAHLGVLGTPLVYAVALGAGIAFVWFDAALFGAVPALVGPDQLTSANVVLWGTTPSSASPGPPSAGRWPRCSAPPPPSPPTRPATPPRPRCCAWSRLRSAAPPHHLQRRAGSPAASAPTSARARLAVAPPAGPHP
jgi:Transmembrane secretion effector